MVNNIINNNNLNLSGATAVSLPILNINVIVEFSIRLTHCYVLNITLAYVW